MPLQLTEIIYCTRCLCTKIPYILIREYIYVIISNTNKTKLTFIVTHLTVRKWQKLLFYRISQSVFCRHDDYLVWEINTFNMDPHLGVAFEIILMQIPFIFYNEVIGYLILGGAIRWKIKFEIMELFSNWYQKGISVTV